MHSFPLSILTAACLLADSGLDGRYSGRGCVLEGRIPTSLFAFYARAGPCYRVSGARLRMWFAGGAIIRARLGPGEDALCAIAPHSYNSSFCTSARTCAGNLAVPAGS